MDARTALGCGQIARCARNFGYANRYTPFRADGTKMIYRFTLLVGGLLCMFQCHKSPEHAGGAIVWAVAVPELRLRAEPGLQSKTIVILSKDSLITEISRGAPASVPYRAAGKEDKVEGAWVRVRAGGATGYVFDAYLKPPEFQGRQYIPSWKASKCCYYLCEKRVAAMAQCNPENARTDPAFHLLCGCGESCEGGGPAAMLADGWTPSLTELESAQRYGTRAEFPIECAKVLGP